MSAQPWPPWWRRHALGRWAERWLLVLGLVAAMATVVLGGYLVGRDLCRRDHAPLGVRGTLDDAGRFVPRTGGAP